MVKLSTAIAVGLFLVGCGAGVPVEDDVGSSADPSLVMVEVPREGVPPPMEQTCPYRSDSPDEWMMCGGQCSLCPSLNECGGLGGDGSYECLGLDSPSRFGDVFPFFACVCHVPER